MALVLNDEDVGQVLNMKDCILTLEEAFRDMGLGTTVNAPRRDSFMVVKSRPDAYYSFKTIEGGLERLGVVAQRINSDLLTYPKVEGKPVRIKVPTAPGNRYVGLIFLYSSETIELLAILTDGHLQRMRVAGTTGVGARYLSREDSKVAAICGAGWQGETAAWALATVRPLTTIRVFDPNKEQRDAFAKKVASTLGIDVISVGSTREAVQGVDIVACATNSHGPVVTGDLIEPGMHITCILPTDFDDEGWRKSDFVITSGPMGRKGYDVYTTGNPGLSSVHGTNYQLEVEAGRFEQYKDKIYMLSDLLLGKSPKRASKNEITMMNKNWGLGIEFASVAKLIYDRARASGIGREIPTEWFSQTSHP